MNIHLKILILAAIASCTTTLHSQKVYDGTIGEKEILTPLPEKPPRINGPKIYGIRPGKKIIYRIPCQGERPLQFSVENLPEGMALDAEVGILSGIVPEEKGKYEMVITAKNDHGSIDREFTIVVGDKMALTPPTGWNHWGGHVITVSDKIVRTAVDVFMEEGLADVGFQYIGIDDCWMKFSKEMYENRPEYVVKKHKGYDFKSLGAVGPIRDEEGNIRTNDKFPDMKALTDYIHSKGLKAGIYSSPGPQTCQRMAGSYGHERADADQYARWGFDLLKYDLCSGGGPQKELLERVPDFEIQDFWKPMSDYLLVQDRDILFNLCQYGRKEPWTWAPSIGIQSWRIGGDLNHNVNNYFQQALRISVDLREYSTPGHWNDPDFMYIHRLRDVNRMNDPSEEIPLTTNQRYQYVTLWSIVCAPFFFSCDIEHIDEFTIRMLANADVVNINQDELGHVAEVVRNTDEVTIMVKYLSDGSKVLAVFNRNPEKEQVFKVSWSDIGESGKLSAYDVWRQKDIGKFKDGISVKLSPHGVGLFILDPNPIK